MSRPNIVFVFADQLRYDSLGCSGNREVRTPNIDRLAREGVACDNAFASAPICGPFRGQLLTGNFVHHTGVICNEYRLRDDQRTIAHHIGSAGYRTAYVGKWHLGYGPYPDHKRYGFDDLIGYNCTHNYYDVSYWHNESGPHRMVEYAPRGETAIALDYLREHSASQPVCLFLSWGPPHWNGLHKARRYGDYPQEHNVYDPSALNVPENVPDALRSYARENLADYYGMVSSLDESMGTLLDGLDELGLAENTIVVFSSDHGDTIGAHGYLTPADTWAQPELRLSKGVPYSEGCRIPLLVRGPGITAMTRTDAMIGSADFMPTLVSLAGLEVPSCDGRDVSGVLTHRDDGPDSVYLQLLAPGWPTRSYPGAEWRAVRTRDALYAEWHEPGDRRLLIDVAADPLELTNLADGVGSARPKGHGSSLEAQMRDRLHDWIALTEDPFRSGRRLPVTGILDLGQALVTRRWHSEAHPEIRECSSTNVHTFRTGEQPNDPAPKRVGW